jgi:hypothetical protein
MFPGINKPREEDGEDNGLLDDLVRAKRRGTSPKDPINAKSRNGSSVTQTFSRTSLVITRQTPLTTPSEIGTVGGRVRY